MIVIIGAGLSGLSTAYFLQRSGRRDFTIFEREERPCGLVRSHETDGFIFDHTGHFLHLRDPEIRSLVGTWLGSRMPEVYRNAGIFSHGIYTRYPFQTNTYGLPIDVVKECLVGYIQARCGTVTIPKDEPVDDPGVPEPHNSFERWIYNTFGPGIARHFMIPYNDRLLGIHPRYLTSEWVDRFMPPVQLEDVIEGAITDKTSSIGYNHSFFYPSKGGIETLGQQFVRHVGTIHTSHNVVKVETRNRRVHFTDSEPVHYETLVSTMPLPELCRCLHPLPHSVADAAGKLRCSSVFAINLGVRDDHTEGRHWVYVPERKFAFYRTGCYSNAARSMAPSGHASIWVEVAYNKQRPLDRLQFRKAAIKSLLEMGILNSRHDIVAEWPIDIPFAYVTFDAHYAQATRIIHHYLKQHNIYSIGRYGCWEYSSMEDAIIHGRRAAERILGRELLSGQTNKKELVSTASSNIPELEISILIPVHNEQGIIEESVRDLVKGCNFYGISYELVLCENGSVDRTASIAKKLSCELPTVRLLQYPKPDYGGALNAGIQIARGRNIVCFEIDFYDIAFVEIAHVLLKKYDAVIGSKRAPGSQDSRPWIRRFITWGFNNFLTVFFRFKGTDTHGIKAFRADMVKPIAAACKTDRDVFTTELVIRMERAGLRMCEIPLEIVEKRPAPINILKRVPGTVKNLWRLQKALRGVRWSERKVQYLPIKSVNQSNDPLC